jgi:hypothetical protein
MPKAKRRVTRLSQAAQNQSTSPGEPSIEGRPEEPLQESPASVDTQADIHPDTVIPTDTPMRTTAPRTTPADLYNMLSHLGNLTDMCLSDTGNRYDALEGTDGVPDFGVPVVGGMQAASCHDLQEMNIHLWDLYGVAHAGCSRWRGETGCVQRQTGRDSVTDFEMMPIESTVAPNDNVRSCLTYIVFI